MKVNAIEKVGIRVETAELAYQKLAEIEELNELDYEPFAIAWLNYLTAWKGVYAVLEQGVKGSAASLSWFEAAKKQRIEDPLFDYLYHARNDEEHGLDRGVALTLGEESFDLADTNGQGVSIYLDTSTGGMNVRRDDGSSLTVTKRRGPGFMLETVHKRNGKPVDPPRCHAGNPNDLLTPRRAAELGLEHIRSLLIQAAELL